MIIEKVDSEQYCGKNAKQAWERDCDHDSNAVSR